MCTGLILKTGSTPCSATHVCVFKMLRGNPLTEYTDLPTLATQELCESTNVKSFWSDTCYKAGITDRTSLRTRWN